METFSYPVQLVSKYKSKMGSTVESVQPHVLQMDSSQPLVKLVKRKFVHCVTNNNLAPGQATISFAMMILAMVFQNTPKWPTIALVKKKTFKKKTRTRKNPFIFITSIQ